MIVSTYMSIRSPVQLLCITGDRIEISYSELIRFLTAPSFVVFLLTYNIMLIVMGSPVYGLEVETWGLTLFWPINSAFVGVLYATAFWYCALLARIRKRHSLSARSP